MLEPDRPVLELATEVVSVAKTRNALVQGRAHVRGEGVEDLILTPPYSPKFQPIELVQGVRK